MDLEIWGQVSEISLKDKKPLIWGAVPPSADVLEKREKRNLEVKRNE